MNLPRTLSGHVLTGDQTAEAMLRGQQFAGSVLDDLYETLDGLPAGNSDLAITRNLSLIEFLGRPAVVRHILESVLESNALLEEVSARSYRHINGFDKLVLVGNHNVDKYRLTLHRWGNEMLDENETPELIHDHRFDLWSTVLTGILESENYVESTDGTKYQNYRYIPEKRDDEFIDFYKYAGDKYLARTENTRLSYGNSYYLRNSSIHQVIKQRYGLTCTLVLRGPRKKTYANIFNTQYPPGDNKFNNRMFSPSQVQMKLESIVREMQAVFRENA